MEANTDLTTHALIFGLTAIDIATVLTAIAAFAMGALAAVCVVGLVVSSRSGEDTPKTATAGAHPGRSAPGADESGIPVRRPYTVSP